MTNRPLLPWPSAELVRVADDDLPTNLRADLPAILVPTSMLGIKPDQTATVVSGPDGQLLVAFAHDLSMALCLDPNSGHVVELVLDPRDGTVTNGPILVNSSLSHFTATFTEAIRRFPFHPDDADMDETQAAADELRSHLSPIDPPAWQQVDGFWDDLYWSVGMGDYAPSWFESPDRPGPDPN